MSELTAAQKEITWRATRLANRRLREELLADTGEYSLARRLALTKGTSIAVLRGSWNPLKPDVNTDSGFGYKLKVEDDRLTIELLRDSGLYKRVVEIGMEAMTEAMVNNSKTFLEAVLNDLFSPHSKYEAD